MLIGRPPVISKNLTVELRHSEAQASLLLESKASINGEGWVRKCIWCDMMERRKVGILCEKEEGNQDQEHWRWIQAALLWYGYSRKRNVMAWCWSKRIWIVLCRWRGCRVILNVVIVYAPQFGCQNSENWAGGSLPCAVVSPYFAVKGQSFINNARVQNTRITPLASGLTQLQSEDGCNVKAGCTYKLTGEELHDSAVCVERSEIAVLWYIYVYF